MSYDLHITKRENWFDKGNDITDEEWNKVLACQPDFLVTDTVEGILEGKKVFFTYKNMKIAKWREYYFTYADGNIDFQQEEQIDKAREIASLLCAKIQGDDGEVY